MSNCYCLEFSFASLPQYELTYTNCTGDTVTETFLSGVTYNICSQDLDPITSCIDINFEVKGFCLDNVCPGDYFKYRNECDVVTIFPMGVQCFVDHPSQFTTTDGIVSLLISGGTPPYFINWANGSHAQTITNLGVGQYSATVVDFYGDFTANTICTLTGATPTPSLTPTPTPTPTPSYQNLCLIVRRKFAKVPFIDLYDFIFNGYLNGKPTWISSDTLYNIIWNPTNNQWEIVGLPVLGTLVNLNPAVPPLTGWNYIGVLPPNIIQSVEMSEGTCASQDVLRYELTVNNPTCEQEDNLGNCVGDGSIIFDIIDGVPPYEYSIDGINYFPNQPIFQNLCAGTYPTSVIDASGQTFELSVTLLQPPPPIVYTITLTMTTPTSFNVTVNPPLPAGVSITYDLVHISNFTVSPAFNAYTFNNTVTVNVNGSPYTTPVSTQTGSSTVLAPPCVGNSTSSVTTTKYQNIIMTQGTTVNGTITNTLVQNLPSNTPCLSATRSYQLYLNKVSISGCNCCSVIEVNPPTQPAISVNTQNA